MDIHRNAEGLVLPTHKDPPDGTYIAIVSGPSQWSRAAVKEGSYVRKRMGNPCSDHSVSES
jgi:hypothetical protein